MGSVKSNVTCPTLPVATRCHPGRLFESEGENKMTYALVAAAPVKDTRTVLEAGKDGGVKVSCASIEAGNARYAAKKQQRNR